MKNFQFVDSDVHVWLGEEARQKLLKKNDSHFFQSGKGIIEVTPERWREAQSFERKTWMELSLAAGDDRNYYHLSNFREYQDLRGRYFRRGIELGCGPFTNFRLLMSVLGGVGQLDLLDPLIDEYVNHPNCTYRTGYLNGLPVNLIKSSIEDWNPSAKYDLVVMINVLEHCFSLPKVFDQISEVLVPGGVFVFADVSTSSDSLFLDSSYDAGHPIRVVNDYLESLLKKDYETKSYYRFVNTNLQEYKNNCHYFVGTKKIPEKLSFEDDLSVLPLIRLYSDLNLESRLLCLLSILDSGLDHWRLRLEIAYVFVITDLKYVTQAREMMKTIDECFVNSFFKNPHLQAYDVLLNFL